MIGKHLKEYKKAYLANRKKNRKSCVKKNTDWKKRWLPFIKYDHDFDGEFLIEIIVHKLHIMLDFYDFGKYVWQVDESRLEIVDELREACSLGDMILADEFCNPAYEILEKHLHTYTTPCEDGEMKGCCQLHMDWDSTEDEAEYEKLRKQGDKEREDTIKKFFSYLAKNYQKWGD